MCDLRMPVQHVCELVKLFDKLGLDKAAQSDYSWGEESVSKQMRPVHCTTSPTAITS